MVITALISDEFIFVMVQLAMAKDPEAAFFKRLEGLQPCEVSELKAGTHIFAVYGRNFLLNPFVLLIYEANDLMEIACIFC